jgi:hypothetical protein
MNCLVGMRFIGVSKVFVIGLFGMAFSSCTLTRTPFLFYCNEDCFRELASHDSRCPCCKKTAETHERMKPTWDASKFVCCLNVYVLLWKHSLIWMPC